MQQPRPMVPQMPPLFPASNITTEQIQSFLDENKKLILAILDNQNLGKLTECAHLVGDSFNISRLKALLFGFFLMQIEIRAFRMSGPISMPPPAVVSWSS